MNSVAPSGAAPGPGLAEPAGDTTVLRMLLGARPRRLVQAARLPGVWLRMVPSAQGGHAAAGESFSILRFQEPERPHLPGLRHMPP